MGGQILSEVLPYLQIEQGNADEITERIEVTTPDLIGKTITETILKELELEIRINNEIEGKKGDNHTIKNQLPQPGIKTYSGGYVYVDF